MRSSTWAHSAPKPCAQIDQRRGRCDPGVRRSHPRRAKARCGRRARSPPLTCLAARRAHAHTRTPVAASRTRPLARARPPALATRRQRASSPRNCAAPNCPASPRSPPPLTCPPARRTRTPARSAPRARLLALAAPWPRTGRARACESVRACPASAARTRTCSRSRARTGELCFSLTRNERSHIFVDVAPAAAATSPARLRACARPCARPCARRGRLNGYGMATLWLMHCVLETCTFRLQVQSCVLVTHPFRQNTATTCK